MSYSRGAPFLQFASSSSELNTSTKLVPPRSRVSTPSPLPPHPLAPPKLAVGDATIQGLEEAYLLHGFGGAVARLVRRLSQTTSLEPALPVPLTQPVASSVATRVADNSQIVALCTY